MKHLITVSSFLEKQPSFIIPVEGKINEFVISQGNELVVVFWDGETEDVKILQNISKVATSVEIPNYFNDAKCDSSGRLWTGNELTIFDK